MQIITKTADETLQAGKDFTQSLKKGQLVFFTGGLGAGKTTFCKGIAAGLLCKDEAHSPTYSIVNVYRGVCNFAHFDAYRIETVEDIELAGLYDYLDEGAIVAVEWSERVAEILPKPDITIDIKTLSESERCITINYK